MAGAVALEASASGMALSTSCNALTGLQVAGTPPDAATLRRAEECLKTMQYSAFH